MRTTQKMLENNVRCLNSYSKGKYALQYEYGKVKLMRLINGVDTRNGISNVSQLCTKNELHVIISTMLKYVAIEKASVSSHQK